MLIEAHKKNLTKQHSELFYWTSNEQFKNKMDLPLEKESKITSASLTIPYVRLKLLFKNLFQMIYYCGKSGMQNIVLFSTKM